MVKQRDELESAISAATFKARQLREILEDCEEIISNAKSDLSSGCYIRRGTAKADIARVNPEFLELVDVITDVYWEG